MCALKFALFIHPWYLMLCTLGWRQILECIYFTHFPVDWMLRSFKCIEISLSDQTPGAETLSKVCVWTNESSAGSVLCSHWSKHKSHCGGHFEDISFSSKVGLITIFMMNKSLIMMLYYTWKHNTDTLRAWIYLQIQMYLHLKAIIGVAASSTPRESFLQVKNS